MSRSRKRAVFSMLASGVLLLTACSSNNPGTLSNLTPGGSQGTFAADGEVPYGAECIDHPDNWDKDQPREQRGMMVDRSEGWGDRGSGQVNEKQVVYDDNGRPTDLLIDISLEYIDYHVDGAPPGEGTGRERIANQEEQLRESMNSLFENFDRESYLALYGKEYPGMRIHAYGGKVPTDGEPGNYATCVSWTLLRSNDEWMSY